MSKKKNNETISMLKDGELGLCTMQLSKKCSISQGILPSDKFYVVHETPFYKNGRFYICKDCIKEYVYKKDKTIDVEKLKNILRIFDIPFIEKDFKSSVEDKKETIGVYFKNIFLNHKNKTWLDSDDIASWIGFEQEEDFVVDDDIISTWGIGFSSGEYQWLEKIYAEYCTSYESDNLATRKLFKLISIKELEIRNARRDGKPTEKLEKAWKELLNESNLTPKSKAGLNENDSVKIYGVWIKDIEKNRPAEYFKDKNIYKDYDNIKEYFSRFILRPMKNLLIGSRDFDSEYMVEDEGKEGDKVEKKKQ